MRDQWKGQKGQGWVWEETVDTPAGFEESRASQAWLFSHAEAVLVPWEAIEDTAAWTPRNEENQGMFVFGICYEEIL